MGKFMRQCQFFAALLLVLPSFANAQIPLIEREALIALYNSTDGDNWWNNTNWQGIEGTECTWHHVHCYEGHVRNLILQGNRMSGSIPPELGNLAELTRLFLNSNQLSGNIPPELGNLSNLRELWLFTNQLSGSIPPELGNLTELGVLYLHDNQLSGRIPPELGSLSSLRLLWLHSNQLSGSIPPELANLTNLYDANIGYNALWTDDPALQTFLDSKDPGWHETQTIAPTGLAAVPAANLSGLVSWTPIIYTPDSGGYRVSYATTPGGPYTFFDMTNNKTDSGLVVHGLSPDTTYYFIVESQTNPHDFNQNTVISEPSAEVMVRSRSVPIPMLGTVGVIVFISMLLLAGAWLLRR